MEIDTCISNTLSAISAATAALLILTGPTQAAFGDDQKDRDQRWQDIRTEIFGPKPVPTDNAAVSLEAPEVAVDAALVPIEIKLAAPDQVAGLYLVIDDNPSPVAAHFTFGPGANAAEIKMRVRVNTYTDMHAVVVMKDGRLTQTSKFIKAAGGCSAPMGVSDEEAMRGMGDMKLKLAGNTATLMIRHPNFNGMQMNFETRAYTPARYIQTIDVTYDSKRVFALSSDISLAANPVITFQLASNASKGALTVDVKDSQGDGWSKTFDTGPPRHRRPPIDRGLRPDDADRWR